MKPQITKPDALPVRQAAVIVWLVLSGSGAMMLFVSCALPGDLLLRAASSGQVPHPDCILCGMTRAVVLISSGEFRQAASLNRGAAPLYFLTLINALLSSWHVGRAFFNGKRQRHRPAQPTSSVLFHTGKEQPCRF